MKPLHMGDDDVYDLRWFLVLKGLIPTSLLLQQEAGRNFETFIASTSGLKPFSSTDTNSRKTAIMTKLK